MTIPAKFDPELLRLLEQTSAESPVPVVEVVIRLRNDDPERAAPAPEVTESTTRSLITRVKSSSGLTPQKVNIFKNLGTFFIEAEPGFIKELLLQPEVADATSNQAVNSALIPPVESRPATIDMIGKEQTKANRRSGF